MYNYHRQIPMEIPASEIAGYVKGADRFYYHLPKVYGHPKYCIDRNGIVYSIPDGNVIQPISSAKIVLDGKTEDIDTLLVLGYIGVCGLNIVPRYIFPQNAQYIGRRCSALTYGFAKIDTTHIDDGYVTIDTEEFRFIPFTTVPMAISRGGVIFNLGYNDFMMRSFTGGNATISMSINEEEYAKMYPGETTKSHIWRVDRLTNMMWAQTNALHVTISADVNESDLADFNAPLMEKIAFLVAKNYTTEDIATALRIPYVLKEDKRRLVNTVYRLRNDPDRYTDLRNRYGIALQSGFRSGKLSDSDVSTIRDALDRGVSGISLAQEYGVAPSMISQIRTGVRR